MCFGPTASNNRSRRDECGMTQTVDRVPVGSDGHSPYTGAWRWSVGGVDDATSSVSLQRRQPGDDLIKLIGHHRALDRTCLILVVVLVGLSWGDVLWMMVKGRWLLATGG
jgi:hypothetical protein